MKRKNLFGVMVLALAASMTFTACSEDNTDPNSDLGATEEELELVINTYVDKTVVPTYADMETRVTTLKNNVDKFVANSTQANLDAACEAWRAAREPWELSESFLFGPADFEDLDPSLDSWPLDKDIIDQILSSGNFETIDADDISGFHTLEYLIFDAGENKTAANVTAAEKSYMAKVAELLLSDTKTLHSAWTDYFAAEFKAHKSKRVGGSVYGAAAQIVEGCITISDEVGSAKIGEPYQLYKSGQTSEAVLKVESWYSWNSLTDYKNNIISIENSYMGGRRGDRNAAGSLSTLVKKYNAGLDAEIQAAIKTAMDAINGIPDPFRNNLHKKTEIEYAQDVLADLSESLLKIKRVLVLD